MDKCPNKHRYLPTTCGRRQARPVHTLDPRGFLAVDEQGTAIIYLYAVQAYIQRVTEPPSKKQKGTLTRRRPHLPTPRRRGRGFYAPPLAPRPQGRWLPARRTQPNRLLRQAPCKTRTRQPGRRGKESRRKPHNTETKKRRHGVRWYGRWLANRTVRFLTGFNLTHSKRTARNDQLLRVVGLFSIYPDKKKTTKNVPCRVMRRAASYHTDLAKQTPHGELTCARTPTASVSLARPASPQDKKLPITTATTAWR